MRNPLDISNELGRSNSTNNTGSNIRVVRLINTIEIIRDVVDETPCICIHLPSHPESDEAVENCTIGDSDKKGTSRRLLSSHYITQCTYLLVHRHHCSVAP